MAGTSARSRASSDALCPAMTKGSEMPEPAAASSLTRHPSFMLFWCARTFTNGAYMMQGVAVGWQIYELTNDPFDLRFVVATCQVSKALAALALAIGTARGALSRDVMLAILFASGTERASE